MAIDIVYVPITDLKPAEYNPRKSSEEQTKHLKESIEKFGFVDPIIVNSNPARKNIIIGGHFRVRAAKDMGIKEAPVVFIDIPDIEREKELNIRLNKNTGDFDFDLLKEFDQDLLKGVGFTSDELDKIFKLEPDEKDDDVPETSDNEFGVKRGDIWTLGRHRLMCGDSTDAGDVAMLMDGKKSEMVHTDPPYNVSYGESKNPRHKIREIENDKQSPKEWESFCKLLFSNIKQFNNGDIYMWGASSGEGMKMRLWLIEMGCHWSATIIWNKDRLVLSPANYQRKYEPCFYGWFEKSSYCGSRTETEVWDLKRPSDSKLHPTMKPIELCEKAIVNSSNRDSLVLDLFLGSGSTLIACEKTSRICYGMEISEHYCSVIINRWQEFTGQKAVKHG